MSLRFVLAVTVVVTGCGTGGSTRATGPAPTDGPAIQIDGSWADWSARAERWRDDRPPARSAHQPRAVTVTNDATSLYLRLELADTVNLQAMPGSLRLALDVDGPATGTRFDSVPGADLLIEMSPVTTAGRRQGVRTRSLPDGSWRDSYGAGFWYGPTVADRQFEIRLARRPDTGPAIGESVVIGLVAVDTADRVVSATPPLGYRLVASTSAATAPSAHALRRPAPSVLRVLTWNVGDDGILQQPEGFRRTFAAIDPDVVLLDELDPEITASLVASLLPGGASTWTVVLGSAGGRQRTAVASRHQIAALPRLARVPYPDSLQSLVGLPMSRQMREDLRTAPIDGIPTLGAVVTVNGSRILFVPVDLLCCGGAVGPEERARRMTAVAIHQAVLGAITEARPDALVIGGDLNLVGSRRPLELLRQGLDPIGGGNLVSASGPRLDQASNATWFAPSPFPPGKLDYLLISPSRLGLAGSFAFHPADLTSAARADLGLTTPAATDHLPLVADLQVRRR